MQNKFRIRKVIFFFRFQDKKSQIHRELCDSINTANVMREISALISAANIYMTSNYTLKATFNLILLNDIAKYITNLMKMFGVIETNDTVIGFQAEAKTNGSSNLEQIVMPYLNALAKFRDEVRTEAIASKDKGVLTLCDNLRDNVLPELGVVLEDQEGRTVVKLCDREVLMKERAEKLQMAERKKAEEAKRKQELERAKAEKEAKKAIPPHKMFLSETDKYSKFDDRGFPILDHEGKELSKSLAKKLEKAYQAQEKDHTEWLASQQQQTASA